MPNNQGLYQTQTERQLQKLSPQQLMLVKLVELPVTELEERVKNEVIDNVALEEGHDPTSENGDDNANSDVQDYQDESVRDSSIDDYATPDDIPDYLLARQQRESLDLPIGDSRSFIEDLRMQIGDYDVTDHQRELIDYLIGSLNDKGFIDRPLASIADDLLFNFNIDTDSEELEEALRILQQFDPAGIGARNLQECLLIQLNRQQTGDADAGHAALFALELDIIANHYDLFVHQNAERLASLLKRPVDEIQKAFGGIKRLNPNPGTPLNESAGDRVQTIIPDFIIETSPDGDISLTLNNGHVPSLRVSREYAEQLKRYQSASKTMSRTEREAFAYTRQKVENAQLFINAIRQRHQTLYAVMDAIIHLQHDFILTQDETQLQPMRLVDVAEHTKLDLSIVSRVRNSKYVMIDGNVYPLDFFFLRSRTNAGGEELKHKEIKQQIRTLIEGEDRDNPYSDQQLEHLLHQSNMNVSRRTIAKYRGEMGIPTAINRKK